MDRRIGPHKPHDPIQTNTGDSTLVVPGQRDLGHDVVKGEGNSPEKTTRSIYSTQPVKPHEAGNAHKCAR